MTDVLDAQGHHVIHQDPSALTTEQLLRELATQEKLFNVKYDAIENKITAGELSRKESLEQASHTIQTGLTKSENSLQISLDKVNSGLYISLTELEVRVNSKFNMADTVQTDRVRHLTDLHEEKFSSIQIQFIERDVRAEQTSRDSKVAVDAALQAAKEAVEKQNNSSALAIAKSETATNKQIDQLGVLITTSTNGLNDKIEDLKERLTRLEGEGRGAGDVKAEGRSSWAIILAGISILVTILVSVFWMVTRDAPILK